MVPLWVFLPQCSLVVALILFDKTEKIETPSKTPGSYTKAELLTLMDKDHWDDMFNKKYNVYIATAPVETTDVSFDVSTLSDS